MPNFVRMPVDHPAPSTVATAVESLTAAQQRLRRRMLSRLSWRAFTVGKLPSLALWGVRVRELEATKCEVTLPYGWRSQNPFRSVYFAAQSGAAELSTGALALLHLEGRDGCSMLVTQFKSKFYKKVSDTLCCVCEDGAAIAAAIAATLADGEGHTVEAHSRGYLPNGELASEFWITWSFRRKPAR